MLSGKAIIPVDYARKHTVIRQLISVDFPAIVSAHQLLDRIFLGRVTYVVQFPHRLYSTRNSRFALREQSDSVVRRSVAVAEIVRHGQLPTKTSEIQAKPGFCSASARQLS